MRKLTRVDEIKELCKKFRIDLIELLHEKQTGHPGGSLSITEILTVLYFKEMNIDPQNPNWEDRDRLVLGKGHAAPMLYLNLAEKGYFSKEELKNFRQINSSLQGHPTLKTPGVDAVTGPLGLGISVASGMAMGLKLDNKNEQRVYCILGDGEIQEGIVWEAAMGAAKHKLNNLICILDNNGVQLDGLTKDIMPLNNIRERWESFGWEVIDIDGHCIESIIEGLDAAKNIIDKPVLLNAETIKGKGICFMENKNIWHGKPIDAINYKEAMIQLKGEK